MFREISLPTPDTRPVIFGDTILKLKYKISPTSGYLYRKDHHQEELIRITKVILHQLLQSNTVQPVKGHHLAVFPGLTEWETGRQLRFIEYGTPLTTYPNIVLLVVHVYNDSGCGSDTVTEIKNRKRSSTDEGCHIIKRRKLESMRNENREQVRQKSSVPWGIYKALNSIIQPIIQLLYTKKMKK